MLQVLNSRYVFWMLLTLPAMPMLAALIAGGVDSEGRAATEFLLHPTGEFSARFMIVAMTLTPLRQIFPTSRIVRWLLARRRYFGVAAFSFAAFHTVLYIVDMAGFQAIVAEFWTLGIWTGWLAFFIFIPLAMTSNDWCVSTMGRHWKNLQRVVYIAAVATLIHWLFVHNNVGAALLQFLPLAVLETYRFWRWARRTLPKKYIPTLEETNQ